MPTIRSLERDLEIAKSKNGERSLLVLRQDPEDPTRYHTGMRARPANWPDAKREREWYNAEDIAELERRHTVVLVEYQRNAPARDGDTEMVRDYDD